MIRPLVPVLFLALAISLAVTAQTPYTETYEKQFLQTTYPQKLPVLFRPYPVVRSDSTFQVYLIVRIRSSFFQFLFEDDRYRASAEVEVVVRERRSERVVSRIWQTAVTLPTYEETNSNSVWHGTLDSLILSPGKYEVLLKYRDLHGQQRLSFVRKMTLDPPGDLHMTAPLFYDPDIAAQTGPGLPDHSLSPLQGIWDFARPLGVQVAFWRTDTTRGIPVRLTLIDEENGAVAFRSDTTLAAGGAFTALRMRVPAERLPEGRHRLKVVYFSDGDSVRKSIPFDLVWFDKPLSLWDRELRIKPLQYILENADYAALTEGGREERARKFRAFWDAQDPTPGTAFNELEREFYSRVDTTLSRYSTRRQLGWETDVGKVYISLGPPDEIVDRSLDPIPDPFMQWIYLRNERKITYTFRALDGRKAFRLTDARESEL